ncbi:hypothetical protein J3E68DRAFT_410388 [Trichoderma sp. SZMC 28012]
MRESALWFSHSLPNDDVLAVASRNQALPGSRKTSIYAWTLEPSQALVQVVAAEQLSEGSMPCSTFEEPCRYANCILRTRNCHHHSRISFSRMEGTCPFCDDDDVSISFQYSFLYLVVKAPITIALNIARVLATLIYPLPSRRIPLLRIIAEHRAQPTRDYGAGRTHGCLPGHPWLLLLLAMCYSMRILRKGVRLFFSAPSPTNVCC